MSVRGAPTDPVLTTASILHSLIVATIAERTRVTASSQGLESNRIPPGRDLGGLSGAARDASGVHHPNALRLL